MAKVVGLLIVAGCHVGAGPVVAYSPQSGFRAGLEASGGVAFVRGTIGATWAPGVDAPAREYLTADPGYVQTIRRAALSTHDRVEFAGGGATIGKAWGDDRDGLAAGAWSTGGLFHDERACQDGYVAYSIAIGYRSLAGISEWFLAPKVSGFVVPFPCT